MSFTHINTSDPIVKESILEVWNFFNSHYSLFKRSLDSFVVEVNSSDGNFVVLRDKEVVFYMNYVSDGLRHLVVNLMAGRCRRSIMLAIGLSMWVILNKGLDGLVFHVNVANDRMLKLVHHAGIRETNALRPELRSFKCNTSYLIKTFGTMYHQFLMEIPAYNIESFRCIDGIYYIANGWDSINSRYHILGVDSEPIVYLKNYDVSLHCTPELLPHLYDSSEEDGISSMLKRHLSNNNITFNDDAERKVAYKPVAATILPTSSCNLACRYCYSEATPQKKSVLDFDNAKAGVDAIFDNAKARGIGSVSFSFLGGGEPMMVVDLNYKIVNYIRQKEISSGITADISISTNGTIYNEAVHRLLGMTNRVQFSMDGCMEVQNQHRPFAGGGATYETVVSNIQVIRDNFPNIRLNVRATVSDYSVTMMPDFVKFLSELQIKSVSFEPLIVTGRALLNESLKMPDISTFARYFIEAYKVGTECGVIVSSSASSVFRKFSFCGATYNNFVITPEGLVSACVEVSSVEDPLSKSFIIGNIAEGHVYVNSEKVSKIRKYDEDVRLECLNCISQKSCRGNCPVRTMRFQKKGESYINELCIMQTKLLRHHLTLLHEKKECGSPKR